MPRLVQQAQLSTSVIINLSTLLSLVDLTYLLDPTQPLLVFLLDPTRLPCPSGPSWRSPPTPSGSFWFCPQQLLRYKRSAQLTLVGASLARCPSVHNTHIYLSHSAEDIH
ncbi:hypothetical protein EYF80_057646 [Liparis tanakae]|uniref:Uncharacterized protein n=1 Tax=Liparis tanakae TaxID=230148 RepID=A0A4Z2ETS2_9TELE|nr:hypothetical protein EYF80_057646 [Liparis tanakae]